ncbi:MEDS domain-containing protein [Rossellomorea aquimaris]|uniref:MEDS domain-containing protein n=1 Tax=Rossellomorea aquimaris TaxID=189382 RepID=UPI001CD7099E|nr:MEDS domain-containing protein [Rossellomorea aquimaris]MCA1057221.1 MEDS domain-containing protein [Rossellomorea aquimaris]
MEEVNRLLKTNPCTHILYCYQNKELYLKNVIAYLIDGIQSGETVILIESEKNLKMILDRLKKNLTESQLNQVHTISNFEFYLSSGSYHPPAIYEQLMKIYTPYFEGSAPYRTWTNVEWGRLEDPTHIVDWFEQDTDKMVNEQRLKLICAYESEKMPADMQSILERSHPYIMSDENLTESKLYAKIKP